MPDAKDYPSDIERSVARIHGSLHLRLAHHKGRLLRHLEYHDGSERKHNRNLPGNLATTAAEPIFDLARFDFSTFAGVKFRV
jgi:hypothetical protein